MGPLKECILGFIRGYTDGKMKVDIGFIVFRPLVGGLGGLGRRVQREVGLRVWSGRLKPQTLKTQKP